MRHLLSLVLGIRCAAAPFSVEVEVLDELGTPLPGAGLSIDTVPRLTPDPWNAPSRRVRVESMADGEGVARAAFDHALPEVMVTAVTPGFYPASRRMVRGSGRARVVLPRRLGSAEAVRVALLTRALPDDGAGHGFDLAMGAFTAPLGVGRQADVWISGRCPSARLSRGAAGAYVDELLMRFARPGDGVCAVPRPGQEGFAGSVSPACDGLLLPGLSSPRLAPAAGYVSPLAYRSARGPAPSDLAGPGRIGAPQWIFRVEREGGALHGLITDFGWVEDGRLRLEYRISTVPGSRSLEFGP